MYSLLLSLFVAAAAGVALARSGAASVLWASLWGVLAFLLAMVLVSWIVRRKVGRAMSAMQGEMEAGRKRLQSQVAEFQRHPKGDPRAFLATLQKKQDALVRDALARVDALAPFRPWIPLFGRQLNASRAQLLWQLKKFDEVDALLPKSLILDPFTAQMKMARQFMKKEPLEAIEKTWRKARARLRYNQSATLAATMAWIYVKRGKVDEAYRLLEGACRDNNTDAEPGATLRRNRDALANNRLKQFSNAGLGDMWYALFLEEPRVRYERREPTRFGKFG